MSSLEQRFPEKRVLISGATSGLGQALALEFARRGWKVAVTGLDAAEIKATAQAVRQAGGTALEALLDVARLADFEAVAKRISEQWQGLDVLVNNAGIGASGRMEDLSIESWRLVMDVNLWSVIYSCHTFLPMLRQGGKGHILNISSASGLAGLPEMTSYNATKAAVVAISETLKAELVDDNIDVTVSCPSAFRSNIGSGPLAKDMTNTVGRGIVAGIQRTKVTAQDVAQHAIRSMEHKKLYSVPQRDARLMWCIARWLPEKYRKLLSYLFRKRLWLFAS